jgi:hypothetical protein
MVLLFDKDMQVETDHNVRPTEAVAEVVLAVMVVMVHLQVLEESV